MHPSKRLCRLSVDCRLCVCELSVCCHVTKPANGEKRSVKLCRFAVSRNYGSMLSMLSHATMTFLDFRDIGDSLKAASKISP